MSGAICAILMRLPQSPIWTMEPFHPQENPIARGQFPARALAGPEGKARMVDFIWLRTGFQDGARGFPPWKGAAARANALPVE